MRESLTWLIVIVVFLEGAAGYAAAAPVPASTDTHHVRAGDTLWALARHYGTSPERLAALNGIPVETTLQIGQRLKVPRAATRRETSSPAVRRAAGGTTARQVTAIYRVRAGDTLWTLARRSGTTPARLAAMNHISLEATLRIGQRLTVPVPARPTAIVPAAPQPEVVSAAARARLAALPSRGAKWASTLVAFSTRYLGVRYRWGGTTPKGFDCSGFLTYVYAHTGVGLPRTTYAMFESGTPVPREELQTGDIVFFQTVEPGPSHAGIYLGDGRFIHSSSGFGRVTITPIDHRYYAPRYVGARRF